MSINIVNKANYCMESLKSGLNNIHTFGSELINSNLVKSSLEKATFACGYGLMHATQLFSAKKHLTLPEIVKTKLVNGKEEDLDWLIGIPSSKIVNTVASPILNFTDPLPKLSSDQNAVKELVTKHSFPKEILEERFKPFRDFVLNSQLPTFISFYKDTVIYDFQNKDIMMLVNGQYVKSEDIIKNFRLEERALVERMFLPPIIVHKSTNTRYAYLENGLIRHDVEGDVRAYQTLPVHQRPRKPIVTFNFCIDAPLESPEDAANFTYHGWCEVVTPSGSCYSFGLYGKGVAQCPDPGVFRKSDKIRKVSFEISPSKVVEIFQKIQQLRNDALWNYHLTKYNCATLMTEIGAVIGIDIAKKEKISRFDNTITRVKMYAISSILANLLRDPDVISKIGTFKELANITDNFQNLPENIKKQIQSIDISNTLLDHLQMKNEVLKYYTLLKKWTSLIINAGTEKLPDLGSISALEIKELCNSILKGSTTELTYKIYNLLDQIYTNYYQYEIHSPGFVYERVKEEKSKQNRKFELKTIM